jgi:CheY-specific phosphatase CheX
MATSAAGRSPRLPESFPDCIREAITFTLGMILGEAPEETDCQMSSETFSGVMGTISFAGPVAWSLTLGLPRDTALGLTETFAGFPVDYDTADMGDAVGELVNVLAGDATTRLSRIGFDARMTLPTVTRGEGMTMIMHADQPRYAFWFETEQGPFWVKIVTSDR